MQISEKLLEDIKLGKFTDRAIKFIGQVIGDEEAIKLAAVLKENPYIKTVYLCNQNIGDTGVKALAAVESIEELDLSNGFVDEEYCNNITADGAISLSNSHLKKLNISGNSIGDYGLMALSKSKTIIELIAIECDIFAKGAAELFRVNNLIKKLNLSNNNIQDAGLDAICYKNYTLSSRSDLSNNSESDKMYLYEEGDQYHAVDLSDNVQQSTINHAENIIEELDLCCCGITAVGAELISNFHNLIKLNLSDNKIQSRGATAIAKLPKLENIILRGCDIGDGAMENLANSKAKLLRLDRNNITSLGVIALSKNDTYREISLSYNKIDSTCLLSLTSMQSLNLLTAYSNHIDNSGISTIKAALTDSNCSLTKIDLMGNPISQTVFLGAGKKRKASEIEEPGEDAQISKKARI